MTAKRFRIEWLVILVVAAIFITSVERLKTTPRQEVAVEMQIALPLFVQVFMVAGDRYLAANIAAIRALVVVTDKMRPEEYRTLAKVQEDVSWLNSAHEDNYYVAAAILPWYGEVDAAQTVLARASRARSFDFQPAFYYAFNLLHFKQDAAGAAAWLRQSAEHLSDENERVTMQNFAARWIDKAQDLDLAIRVVEAMATQAKRKDFRVYLEMRVARLKSLQMLRQAAGQFREKFGRPPVKVEELQTSGVVKEIPKDPFGVGFGIDPQGQINFSSTRPKK